MRIHFFSKADLNGRSAFRSYYILQNLKTVKSISVIYFVFTLIIRGLFLAFNLSNRTFLHLDEYNAANWLGLAILPIFYFISTQLIKTFATKPKFLQIAQSFVLLFAIFIIFSAMRATFFSMHNPRNTLVMYMMGLIIIGAFYTFEYYETIAVALATGIIFSTLLPFYQHSIDELVLTNLASMVVLVSFFCISRYLFSYRADNFLKLKAIEEKNIEIENASNAKNEILGVVAHDLRNPLAVIKSITMLMEMDDFKADDYLENLQMIQVSCDKASFIINDLLETAQNEVLNNFELEKTELGDFFFSRIDEWLKNKKGQINITYTSPDTPVFAQVNKEKLQRVMDNLIINAIKFSGPNGNIDINLSTVHNEVSISVKDSGIGIPQDMLPYIFDRFSKAGRKGIRGEASVGLGLSIVRQIIRKHDGEIEVDSSEKQGTTFTITLPQVKSTVQAQSIVSSHAALEQDLDLGY
jgi:two-component system sensor histidine kinase VicK